MTRIPNRRGLLTPYMFVPYRMVMPDATCSTERRRRFSNPWACRLSVRTRSLPIVVCGSNVKQYVALVKRRHLKC